MPPHKRAWNLIGDLETAVGGCFQPIQNQPQGWVGGGINIINILNPNVCEFEAKHCILAQNFFLHFRELLFAHSVSGVTVIDKYEIYIILSSMMMHHHRHYHHHHHQNSEYEICNKGGWALAEL